MQIDLRTLVVTILPTPEPSIREQMGLARDGKENWDDD